MSTATVKHSNEDTAALTNCFVVKATEGNRRLDGNRASDVTVTVEYRSTTKTSSEVDVIMRDAVDAIYNPATVTTSAFTVLEILYESENERDNEKNLRTFTRTFPVIAKLA